jgi:hypothetical protein
MATEQSGGVSNSPQAEIIPLRATIDPAFPAKLAAFKAAYDRIEALPTAAPTLLAALQQEAAPLRLALLHSKPGTLQEAIELQRVALQALIDEALPHLPLGVLDGLSNVMLVMEASTGRRTLIERDGFHARQFARFSAAILICSNLSGDESDAEADAALDEAADAFDSMMNGQAGSLSDVILKAKVAAMQCNRAAESAGKNRELGALFAMLAMELEAIAATQAGTVRS